MADQARAIPQARADDNEDVAWALSTAEAMWSRGELADAIKWVRRAAEAASDAEMDIRALELAKAAAELTAQIGGLPSGSKPPPKAASVAPPPRVSPSTAPPAVVAKSAAPIGTAASSLRRPSNAPPRPGNLSGAPIGGSAVPSVRPAAGVPSQSPARPTNPPPPAASSRPRSPLAPSASASSAPSASKSTRPRAGLSGLVGVPDKSTPLPNDIDSPEDTAQVSVPVAPSRATRRSRPPRGEVSSSQPPMRAQQKTPPHAVDPSFDPTSTQAVPASNMAAEIDAWPTQAVSGDDHTEAGLASLVAALPPMRAREPSRQAMDPDLLATQAVRVVVWRTPDGVRVAPAGTVVSAIACDAVLVALDPTADLSAWLTNKH